MKSKQWNIIEILTGGLCLIVQSKDLQSQFTDFAQHSCYTIIAIIQ